MEDFMLIQQEHEGPRTVISRQRMRELLWLAGVELSKILPPPNRCDEYMRELVTELFFHGTPCDKAAVYREEHVHDEPDGVQ